VTKVPPLGEISPFFKTKRGKFIQPDQTSNQEKGGSSPNKPVISHQNFDKHWIKWPQKNFSPAALFLAIFFLAGLILDQFFPCGAIFMSFFRLRR
jgi:hypothetical protein